MAKKNEFNTVTKFSKALAFIMFVTFPFLGFYIGMHFQKELDRPFMQELAEMKEEAKMPKEGVMCPTDAKICSDGSAVGRSGPNCQFAKCPGEY